MAAELAVRTSLGSEEQPTHMHHSSHGGLDGFQGGGSHATGVQVLTD